MSNEEMTQNEALDVNLVDQKEKDFNRNKWLFSIGGIGRDMLYCLVSTYFLQYVQFGLTLTAAQFTVLYLLIGIAGRIWDGINDPMMGAIIDGSHLKWGKFKPWIFFGAILDAIFTVAMFNIRPTGAFAGWAYIGVIFAVYLLWEAAFTMNDIGYWSMIPSLSRTKERRDKITTLTIFFAGLGTIIMTAMVTYLAPGNLLQAYSIFSIIACVAVIGLQTMTSFGVKEMPREESEVAEEKISFKRMVKTIFSNKQLLWMALALLCSTIASGTLLSLVYNLYYLEVGYDGNVIFFIVIYAVANTAMQLIYPMMSKKLGRKKIQLISLIVMTFGYVGLILAGWFPFFPLNLITLCIFGLPVFVGYTWFYTATLVNISNCVEYNEYTTGSRNEAVVSTVRPLIVKFGDAFKYAIVTLTLVISGIYALSQNVSQLESQVNKYKSTIDTVEENVEYVTELQKYDLLIKADVALGKEINDDYYAEMDKDIEANSPILVEMQIQAKYIEVYVQSYIQKYDANKKEVDVAKISEINALTYFSEDYKYELNFTGGTMEGKDDVNVATATYQAKRSFGSRFALRISCAIVPLTLMFVSFLLQRYKFIIDEAFFENMMKEIEERKALASLEAPQEEAPVEEEVEE